MYNLVLTLNNLENLMEPKASVHSPIYINVYNRQVNIDIIDDMTPTFHPGELHFALEHAKYLTNDLSKLRGHISNLREAQIDFFQSRAILKNICRVLATALAVGLLAGAIIGGILLGGGAGAILGISLIAIYTALSFAYKKIFHEQSKSHSILLAPLFPIMAIQKNFSERNSLSKTINAYKDGIQTMIWRRQALGGDAGQVDIYVTNPKANESEYKGLNEAYAKCSDPSGKSMISSILTKLHYYEDCCKKLGQLCQESNQPKLESLDVRKKTESEIIN